MALSPAGRFVAVGNAESEVFIYDLQCQTVGPTFTLLCERTRSEVTDVCFVSGGRSLVCSTSSGTLWRFDVAKALPSIEADEAPKSISTSPASPH